MLLILSAAKYKEDESRPPLKVVAKFLSTFSRIEVKVLLKVCLKSLIIVFLLTLFVVTRLSGLRYFQSARSYLGNAYDIGISCITSLTLIDFVSVIYIGVACVASVWNVGFVSRESILDCLIINK